MLTTESRTALAREALRSGARGYVLEQEADSDLVDAVRTVAGGGTYLTPVLGAQLAVEPAVAADRPDDLTPREVEVLRLIVLGHTNWAVAEQLSLSVRTVESHRAHIQQKLRRRPAPSWCATRSTTACSGS